jgi:hypothetical protein
MRRDLVSAAVVIAMLSCSSTALAADCSSQEAELRSIKLERWPGFYRSQDVAGLDRFLVDGFQIVDSQGKATPKDDELRWLAANPWTPRDFVYEITSVTCPTPAIAIIVGQGRSTRADGSRRVAHSYVSSNVLVRSEAGWQAVLSHISGERREPVN